MKGVDGEVSRVAVKKEKTSIYQSLKKLFNKYVLLE